MPALMTDEVAVISPDAGISWPAVLGGAIVATAVAIMLMSLGSGLGLAWVSPVSDDNPSGMTFTVVTAIWLIVVQWISSFFGGYLAGRLRPAALDVDGREILFRDTAAGFVAWAIAAVLVVGLVGSAAWSAAGGVGKSAATMLAGVGAGASSHASSGPGDYMLDTLFRTAQPDASLPGHDVKSEAGRILATAATGQVTPADHDYLAQLVAARTGISPEDAGKRVDLAISTETQAVAKARHIADLARKAASSFALYTFFSMLVGAFIASVAGAIGGGQRDAF
ncbi:hypothetical protein GLI01_18970 [Gluconacetobacter liquefaciens]|uniref:Uncharacterized protein n=1 Tax=Gluconacetobacter liquefaciens TaxID=89584 RepID=A0A370G065_GLULI|nr:hypothetical protein [Gluconacetobacter liquefaciens]MBB2187137.1 hypothetical protein [Gluconacetobacter liquefaciens]RDI37115.1 hypothetical protein C7453_107162 [Gluconacetobacter liquefaciens]GBQ94030.1 hypothetical protein AA0522_0327 [Gluconacetobacter liquefaciens NRIC 0522]GEB37862.1 hypothetical protein GLI01_18970 [Gluconacetobacter liquefaciens]